MVCESPEGDELSLMSVAGTAAYVTEGWGRATEAPGETVGLAGPGPRVGAWAPEGVGGDAIDPCPPPSAPVNHAASIVNPRELPTILAPMTAARGQRVDTADTFLSPLPCSPHHAPVEDRHREMQAVVGSTQQVAKIAGQRRLRDTESAVSRAREALFTRPVPR